MRIKKFFELFDTEELKSEHEIDYLTGKLNNLAKTSDTLKIKEETIGKFIAKTSSFHFPFFDQFLKSINSKDNYLKFDNCKIKLVLTEDQYWTFVTESIDGSEAVALGLKINKINDYDAFIITDQDSNGKEYGDAEGIEYTNLSYDELIRVIKNVYIPALIEFNFEDLIESSPQVDRNN